MTGGTQTEESVEIKSSVDKDKLRKAVIEGKY